MSSLYSVLHPNYRGTKKYSVLVSTQILVVSDFTEYKGNKLLNRNAYLKYGDKFNRVMVQLSGEKTLVEVKEASYTVRKKNYYNTVIDVLLAFDVFANSAEEAVKKMRRTLEGDIVINNFILIDADTSRMDFDCEVLSYQFDDSYLIKEITIYDEMPKKYEQLASLKVFVKGDIPKLIEGIIPEEVPECFGEWIVPYKSDDLSNDDIYKFEGFKLTIEGLKKIDYKLLPISFNVIGEGVAEFYFAFNFNVYGYSPDHVSDLFEQIFNQENIKIDDFIFIDDENFITTKLEVIKIYDTIVEEVAQEYGR
ncbi:hypothetical protein [Lysinibacillus sphaericus]|uniref:Uncharacterized protein n=1 Tax=Lysinibacillus sphaericus OT4b.31 TaxID=1285586 RepID=R7ZDQ7_LYSSH|nr:hypothetical protein [Lysinibacillus sphaericus]EON72233.1 hypothetical protein H131_11668 [Lysinibacillus sphaericus OT4b.31]